MERTIRGVQTFIRFVQDGFLSERSYRDRCLPRLETCGSGLARDGSVSDNITVECADSIAGKPAPTGFCGVFRLALTTNQWRRLRVSDGNSPNCLR